MELVQNHVNRITDKILLKLADKELSAENKIQLLQEIKKVRDLSYIKEEYNNSLDVLTKLELEEFTTLENNVDSYGSTTYQNSLLVISAVQDVLVMYSRKFS